MATAYPHEINPDLDDVAENHVLAPSELSDTIESDAIIGLPSRHSHAGTYIDDYAEDHVSSPSELKGGIGPDVIIGDPSKPFAGSRPEPT